MAPLDDPLGAIRLESDRFYALAEGADPSRPVPSCPEWTVADLVWHLGEVHWFWATDIELRATDPDTVEAATLREVFGAEADRIPVSNTKAQLGHLMGATAGVELAVTLLSMKHNTLPPCRNLDHPDPRCALNFVRQKPLPADVRIALKNSFAFGGTNCAVVLGRMR